jgi:hypothetical protein
MDTQSALPHVRAAAAAAAAAAAVYMVYCLILLVELTPKQHLALGIAVLSAGEGQEHQQLTQSGHMWPVSCYSTYTADKLQTLQHQTFKGLQFLLVGGALPVASRRGFHALCAACSLHSVCVAAAAAAAASCP